MDAFEAQVLSGRRAAAGQPYLEFLRVSDLSAGIYEIPAGGEDLQSPHTEDELYLVRAGRAAIHVGDEDRPVGPGSIVYVAAGVAHRFHTIEEDLSVLVVFGPSEGSRAGRG